MNMIGELEATLERTRGDALIEHFVRLRALALFLRAADRQRAFLDLDRKLLLRETGDRDCNAVGVLGRPFDIIGWIGGCPVKSGGCLIDETEETIEPYGRTIERREIHMTHVYLLK
jgi:hypothetical protein